MVLLAKNCCSISLIPVTIHHLIQLFPSRVPVYKSDPNAGHYSPISIQVDGMERFAPVVLTSRGVSISQSGRYMELLVANCGLELAFDGVYRVVVRVPKATHAGNYNSFSFTNVFGVQTIKTFLRVLYLFKTPDRTLNRSRGQ